MATALDSDTIIDAAAAKIAAAPVISSPCDHIHLESIFPASFYQLLISNLPDIKYYKDQVHSDAMMPDGRSARRRFELTDSNIRKLPPAQRAFWTEALRQLKSEEIQKRFLRAFDRVLRQRFKQGLDKVDIYQRAVLFKDIGGYKISVHADNLEKVITSQFYLPKDDSQLHLGTSFHERLPNGEFKKVKTLPFAPNSGYAFPVTDQSWHSVEQLRPEDKPRESLMLIYYQTPSSQMKLKNLIKIGRLRK